MDKCRHCKMKKNIRKKGLCRPCYVDPKVRAMYPPLPKKRLPGAADGGVTEEELNAMIAEQSKTLPKWWKKATPPQDEPEPLTVPFLKTKLPRRTKSSERIHAYVSRSW